MSTARRFSVLELLLLTSPLAAGDALSLTRPLFSSRYRPPLCAVYGRGSYKKSVPDALRAFAVGCSEGSTDSCFEGGRALLGDANSHQRFVAWEAAQKSTAAGSTPAASSSTEAAAAGAPPAAPRRPVFRYQDAVSLGLDFLDRGCKAATSASAGRCCGLLAASYIAGFSRDAAAPAGGAVSGVDIPSLPAAGIKLTEAVSAAAAAAAAARAEELSGAGPGDGPRAESASLPAFTAAFPSRAGEILQYLTVACELEDADACMTLSKLFVRGLTTDGKAWLAPPAGSPAAAAPAPPLVPDPARAAQSFRQGLLWLGVAEKAADKEVEKRIKNGLFGAMPPATAPGAAKLQ